VARSGRGQEADFVASFLPKVRLVTSAATLFRWDYSFSRRRLTMVAPQPPNCSPAREYELTSGNRESSAWTVRRRFPMPLP